MPISSIFVGMAWPNISASRTAEIVPARMLAARLNELEHRMETRFERAGWNRGGVAAVPPMSRTEPLRNEPLVRNEPLREHAAAEEEARQAQMREEERMRDERARELREVREERRDERVAAADRPGEQPSGWRRWF